jgi:hypothetical protein
MNQPMLSIIVPAFNAADCIERCIESVLRQTCSELEVIAVDDASSDLTASKLDDFARRDNRVRVLHLNENRGVHAARAAGLVVARGGFIGFVDSDDYVRKWAYETLLGICRDTSADIAVCGAQVVGENTQVHGDKVRFAKSEVIRTNIFDKFCDLQFGSGLLWNKLYRRDLIIHYGSVTLPRNVDAAEDYIVNVGCFADAKTVATVADQLYCYVARPESASRRGSNAAGFLRVLRAYETCLRIYHDRREILEGIDRLYSRQLEFECYRVASVDEFTPYHSELRAICESLATLRPEFVYTLATRSTQQWNSVSGSPITNWLRATKRLLAAACPDEIVRNVRAKARFRRANDGNCIARRSNPL